MITVIEHFVNSQELLQLNRLAQTCQWVRTEDGGVWDRRSYPLYFSSQYEALAKEIHNRIRSKMQEVFDKELYADSVSLARWTRGDSQEPHADGEEAGGVRHRYHWREYGCVLYLNSRYRGGHIYFPNQNLRTRPKPGTLVFFPGTLEYLHGVEPVKVGQRFTLNSFWTTQKHKRCRFYYD